MAKTDGRIAERLRTGLGAQNRTRPKDSLEARIARRIDAEKGVVFLRRDFETMP